MLHPAGSYNLNLSAFALAYVNIHIQWYDRNRSNYCNFTTMLVQVENRMRDAGGFRIYEVQGMRTEVPVVPVRGRQLIRVRENSTCEDIGLLCTEIRHMRTRALPISIRPAWTEAAADISGRMRG
jgi:hypothetical protein